MSTGGQIAGGVVGGVIGAVVGGPTGAIYGAQIGIMAGGMLDPPKGPTVEGPRLNDLTVQTSTYGQFIPRTYGTIGLSGNVFWLENNKIKEVVKKKKSGGKGGGSSATVKTYTYFATFAVGLCEGPIAGVRRIWVGPDLIYDAGSDDIGTIIASNQASSKFTIYLGTDTQQPDPRMQAEIGVANCPAYRGLAYIVMKDLALAKYGNSVAGAQVRVEVVNDISSSVFLAEEIIKGYTNTVSYAFTALPFFMSEDRVVLYAPKWNGSSYPSTSSIVRYEISASGQMSEKLIPVTGGTSSPPRGTTDDDTEFWVKGSSVFTSPVSFRASRGYIVQKDGIYCGISSTGGRKLYSKKKSDPLIEYSIATTAYCIAIYGSSIYAISPTGVKVYDYKLDEIASYTFTLPAMSFPDARACFDGQDIVLYSAEPALSPSIFSINLSSGTCSLIAITPVAPISEDVCEVFVSPSIMVRATSRSDGVFGVLMTVEWYSLTKKSPIAADLSYIVRTEAVRSSLIKSPDIDTTGLVDSVTGFKVTATGSIRNAIEPLRGAWPFDVVQSGYKIKATSRGSASVVTIPVGELAIGTQLTESREMDSQLPQNVTVKYIDQGRDYDVNEQRAQRDNTEAVNSLNIDLPVVLSATQAAQVADKLIRIYALEKSDFSFTLPAPYRYLEPGDVVTIATSDASYVLRLVSVNHTADGRLECAGRPSSASTYVSIAPGDQGQGGQVTIPLAGSTSAILIDAPVIDEGLQDSSGVALAMNGSSSGWPGGTLFQSADSGQTWTDLQAIQGQSTSGTASTVLESSAGNLVQLGGSLTVSMLAGTLESVTEAQMFNGANIAVYGQPGRWEVIRFQNATLISAGVYTLDTFWRGDRGTEWATGLHVVGDQFILMTDPDLAFVGMPTDSIGSPRDYLAITSGAEIDSAASQSFTYLGVNLETYSGVHATGSRSSNDLTIKWQRRTRVGGAWRDNVDASLGETSEAYEVDIMQGAVVKRTLTATTPSVLYTSAMQVTDFGSNQSSVTVNIYQLSSVVGRGYPLGATL